MKNSKKVWKQNQLYLKRCKGQKWCKACNQFTWDGRKWNSIPHYGTCTQCVVITWRKVSEQMNMKTADEFNKSVQELATVCHKSFYETGI